jgi:hypothetical protein
MFFLPEAPFDIVVYPSALSLKEDQMPLRLRLFFSGLTGILLLIPSLALYRELSMPADIWWTPTAMAVPLAESRDRVEIYVRGEPLGGLLNGQKLWIRDEGGSRALGAQEIGLRFNNRDRVRAGRLPLLLAYAAICGGGVVILFLIAAGRLAYRGEDPRVAA